MTSDEFSSPVASIEVAWPSHREQLQEEGRKFVPCLVASEKMVKICRAWAYPGQTEYDNLRIELLEQAGKKPQR